MFARTVDNGADSSIYLSTSDEVKGVSGKYFFKCKEIRSSRASYDKEDWQKVWDLCENYKDEILSIKWYLKEKIMISLILQKQGGGIWIH